MERMRAVTGILVFLTIGTLAVLLNAQSNTFNGIVLSGYTGAEPRMPPTAPALGPANSILIDPVFGSRILRVTDSNTLGGVSFISEDAGFIRTFNADQTAIKLEGGNGLSYWVEFDPINMRVGNGSAAPQLHQVPSPLSYSGYQSATGGLEPDGPFYRAWSWSAVNPDVIYFMNTTQIAAYNKATAIMTNLGGPPNGDLPAYHITVVGQDQWVCSAAGPGSQNCYTKFFCLDPNNPSNYKLIDLVNKTINGVPQSDPNWPTWGTANDWGNGCSNRIGIHSLEGAAVGPWLDVDMHQDSWGADGDSVFNLNTNTWSLLGQADLYWGGHASIGNGRWVNACTSKDGWDDRGMVVRNPDDLENQSTLVWIMNEPSNNLCPYVGNGGCYYNGDHNSWYNSVNDPYAPVLTSRYITNYPNFPDTWFGEIMLVASDGSGTVWRYAHTHNNYSEGFFNSAFAQISNDGRWALFSTAWDDTLGASGGQFGIPNRLDTFIVELGVPAGVPVITSTVPAALYAFNEGLGTTTADMSPHAATASLLNASWGAGKYGDSLALLGNGYAEAPDAAYLTPGAAATFESWINLSSAPTELTSIINKWSQSLDDEYLFGLNPDRTLFFSWHTTGGDNWGGTSYNSMTGSFPVPLNRWTHVALVRSSQTVNFYINGILDASAALADANPFRNGVNSLRIGGQGRGGMNRFLTGNIDETRIYSRALSQAEIQADMNSPIPTAGTGVPLTPQQLVVR